MKRKRHYNSRRATKLLPAIRRALRILNSKGIGMKATTLKVIPLSSIILGDRFRKDYGDIVELAASIKEQGLITPIAVKELGDGKYELLAGGRRYTALQVLEIENVNANVYDSSITELDYRSIELAENLVRKELEWTEEVALKAEIHRLQVEAHGPQSNCMDKEGWSMTKTAELLGETKGMTSQDLRVAYALEAIPDLARMAKSKKEAYKLLNKLGEEIKVENRAAEIRSIQASTPVQIQKQSLANSYIVQDFFSWASTQEPASFDMAEIDPPYGVGIGDLKYSDTDSKSPAHVAAHYNEISEDDYPAFLERLFTTTYQLLKPDSWMVCWFGWKWFAQVWQSIMNSGFMGNNIPLIWVKTQGQTMHPEYYLGSSHEPAFYVRKGMPNLAKQGRLNNYQYRMVSTTDKTHPTERPIEMITDVLATFVNPGARILSPFLGSGNTILAASNIGCTCVGCDLSQMYHDYFTVKVQEGEIGDFNSYRSE